MLIYAETVGGLGIRNSEGAKARRHPFVLYPKLSYTCGLGVIVPGY